MWRRLPVVAHLVRDEGVSGSNPATPTNKINDLDNYGCSEIRQPRPKPRPNDEKIPPNKRRPPEQADRQLTEHFVAINQPR
jgi:hypothetical protein